jgi:iron complex outermembrane recepter protein
MAKHKKAKINRIIIQSASVIALGTGTPALAQQATPPAAPEADNGGIADIVVTARRRSENLRDVPVAVTAFSAASLDARAVSNVAGLANFAPNVELNSGNPNGGSTALQAFIRGVGQSDYLFPNDPGVGLYVDGVYISRTVGGLLDLADVEQIEILRGPQGVLYGKNTIGGAINVSTRLPDGETRGAIEAITGRFNRSDVKGYVTFPISDTLSGKVSGAYIHRNGYGRQVLTGRQLGDDNRFITNAALRWQPSAGLDFILRGDFTRTDQGGQAGTLGRLYAFDVPLEALYKGVLVPILNGQLGLPAGSQLDGRYISANRFDSFGTAPTFDKSRIWGVSLTSNIDLNDTVALKSITAFRHLKAEIARDTDHTPYTLVSTNTRDKQRQFSQEFQLAGATADKRLNWLLGLYYLKEHAEDFNTVGILSGTLPVFGFELDLTPQNTIDVTSTAAFAHASFALTDKLSVSGGLRWSRDQKTYDQLHFRTVTRAIVVDRTLERAWSAVTYKGSIDYKPTDDALLYASVSRGFKSGGWSPRPNSAADGQIPFNPEFLLTWELGAKTEWFDRRLILNAALFTSTYSNIQLSVLQPSGNSISINVLNAGEARVRGFELEAIARPIKGLDLSATLSHLDGKYTKLGAGVTDVTLTTPLREAPPWSATLGAQYRFEVGSGGFLSLRGDATYKGRVLKDFGASEKIFAPSYWLYSARLAYTAPDDQFEVALFGTNLSDARYISNAQQVSAFGYNEVYYGRPREWGLSGKFQF